MAVINREKIYTTVELIGVWAYRSIRARYRQSVLGGLWAILQPAASVAIFSIIFTYFIPVNTGDIPYVVFSYAAMVPWTLFSNSINDMIDSIVGSINLITKIYFQREVLPIAAMLARVFDFLVAIAVLAILMVIYHMPFIWKGILIYPFILLFQLLLSLGVGLIGASLNVFYRDMRPVFSLLLQIWFYATPIIYPISAVPKSLLPLYYLNPMTGFILAYRAILFGGELPIQSLLYSIAMSILICGLGFLVFKRVEPKFADIV